MISMLASSVVDQGFELHQFQPKTTKLLFAASPLSLQHSGVKARKHANHYTTDAFS
jgi:hypothetical protein